MNNDLSHFKDLNNGTNAIKTPHIPNAGGGQMVKYFDKNVNLFANQVS